MSSSCGSCKLYVVVASSGVYLVAVLDVRSLRYGTQWRSGTGIVVVALQRGADRGGAVVG